LKEPLGPLASADVGIKPSTLRGCFHTSNTEQGSCGGFLVQNNHYVGLHTQTAERENVKVNIFTRVEPVKDGPTKGALEFFRAALK